MCVVCSVVFVGGFSGGVTPGPFPNPEAKPACADGTAPGRVWESRSPPAFKFEEWGWAPVADDITVVCNRGLSSCNGVQLHPHSSVDSTGGGLPRPPCTNGWLSGRPHLESVRYIL